MVLAVGAATACGATAATAPANAATATAAPTASANASTTIAITAYRFAVWGDVRPASSAWPTSQSAGFTHMIASLAGHRYAANIAVGDYIDLSTSDDAATVNAKYAAFKSVAAPVLKVPSYFTLGNHEVVDGYGKTSLLESLFRQNLGVSGTVDYYWKRLDHGRINLIVLDTEVPGFMQHIGYLGESATSNSAQAKWLVATLKTIRARNPRAWIVVSDHRPIADPETGDALATNTAERTALKALFTKYGVDLSVAGDTHYYRRHVERTGPTYLVQGTGGAPSDAVNVAPVDRHDVAKAGGVFGYTLFRLADGKLRGTTIEASPSTWQFKVIDTFLVPNRRAH